MPLARRIVPPLVAFACARAALSATALAAGVAISALCHALALLWNAFLLGRPRARLCLALAAAFPGAIYQHAVFPITPDIQSHRRP